MMELSEGYAVGPYRLVGRAGAGGMAEVWRAYDARLKRYVAIKFLSPRYATDETYLERFRHEAQAISRLDHPNILTIFDYGEQEGWTYMVSPYIGGGTLATQLRRGPWTVEEAVSILEPLAAALDYAHAEGIVHRDVKPSNVLFTDRGRLVLSDFGIARMIESSSFMSHSGLVIGTPMYMSPEQADAQPVNGASDLYSLGVIAYEMLTGRPPYMADTPLALLRAHIDKPLPPPRTVNPALSDEIQAALFTVLAKDPGDRFPSGHAFVEALRLAAPRPAPRPAPVPPPPVPPTPLPPTPPPPEPPRLLRRMGWRDVGTTWPGPLALIGGAWAVASVLLITMRQLGFEPLYPLYYRFIAPLTDAYGTEVVVRSILSAMSGLIAGAGLALALVLTRSMSGWRSTLGIVGGWALSYGLIHGAIYAAARVFDLGSVTQIDPFLGYLSRTSVSRYAGLFMVLMALLPAILGGCITASILRRTTGRWSVRLPLGWAGAAFLGLAVAALADDATRSYFGTGTVSTPIGHGLIVGLFSGAVEGLVGGYLTLVGLPRLSPPPPSGSGMSSPTLPLSSQIPTRGGPTGSMGLLVLLVCSLLGVSACTSRSEPPSASNPPPATARPQTVTPPSPSTAAAPPRTASPSPVVAPSPAVSPVARDAPPAAPGTVVLSETFEKAEQRTLDLDHAAYKEGEYALSLFDLLAGRGGRANPVLANGFSTPLHYRNSSIAVDARVIGDPALVRVSVSCRAGTGDEYALAIRPDIGQFQVGEPEDLLDWDLEDPEEMGPFSFPSDVIRRGTATNRLELHCLGDRIEAIINGKSQLTMRDARRQSGPMRVEARGKSGREVRVDNLVITQR